MGASISTEVIEKELEKLISALDNNSIPEVVEQCSTYLNILENTTLNIAITGGSGAGKSSLVNAMRGMPDYGEGAAPIGEVQTTTERKGYPHPTFPKVFLWDLPGIGTPQFEPKQYLEKIKFEEYDFFIIVGSNRFSTNDVLLAREIQKMEKKFYYVRSKMDNSMDSERRKPDFNEEECLEKIRTYCCECLMQAGESEPKVFLISSWHLKKYDFPVFVETLENDLPDLKRIVFIASLPAFSKEALEKKKATMNELIWKVALVSCCTGAIPVPIPRISFVCDIETLVGTMTYFRKVFGLDEDSLCSIAKQVDKPFVVLQSAIRKCPTEKVITADVVIHLLKPLVCRGLKEIIFAADCVPFLGTLVGGATSFAITFYFLKSFLNDVMEDVENVHKAARSRDM